MCAVELSTIKQKNSDLILHVPVSRYTIQCIEFFWTVGLLK